MEKSSEKNLVESIFNGFISILITGVLVAGLQTIGVKGAIFPLGIFLISFALITKWRKKRDEKLKNSKQ